MTITAPHLATAIRGADPSHRVHRRVLQEDARPESRRPRISGSDREVGLDWETYGLPFAGSSRRYDTCGAAIAERVAALVDGMS